MVLDIIPSDQSREYRAEYAAITQAIAIDDSPIEMAAMQFALLLLSEI